MKGDEVGIRDYSLTSAQGGRIGSLESIRQHECGEGRVKDSGANSMRYLQPCWMYEAYICRS